MLPATAATDEAGDLRKTAVHEAGHAVVAEAVTGVAATVVIERRARGGSVWHKGRCIYVTPPTASEEQLIALAGPVAEVLASPQRGNSGDALASAIVACMSLSDMQGAGLFGRADLDRALRVVWRLWPSVESRALREIAHFQDTEQRRRGGAKHTK